jgi:chromosome segregation ATPase
MSAVLLTACLGTGGQQQQDNATIDSLQNILDQKDQDLNELMTTLNEIQEGFDQINQAEGRVNVLNQDLENGSARVNIADNMEFIQQTLLDNRKKIEELQGKLKQSNINSGQLKQMVDKMTEQLEQKTQEIEQLRQQLEEKDVRIAQLDETVTQLQDENARVTEERNVNEQIARNQDAQLNTAYFVYGTSRELKDHRILVSGDVLESEDFDRDYFTKIDIRKTTVIPLLSKSAKLLTTHPEGSYTLLKDSQGQYTLRITDAYRFWSVSKYLVIKVK